jgi:hypothetical protein
MSIGTNFKSGQIYWIRVILGVVAAFICFYGRLGLYGLIVGLIMYIASFPVALKVFNGSPIEGEYRSSLYTLGLGSYVSIWLTTWILLHTYFSS